MNIINPETLAESMVARVKREADYPFYLAIFEGFYPFKVTNVVSLIDYDIVNMEDRLIVEVYTHDYFWPFTFTFDRDYYAAFHEEAKAELTAKIFHACRYRAAVVVPHNIELGEN